MTLFQLIRGWKVSLRADFEGEKECDESILTVLMLRHTVQRFADSQNGNPGRIGATCTLGTQIRHRRLPRTKKKACANGDAVSLSPALKEGVWVACGSHSQG